MADDRRSSTGFGRQGAATPEEAKEQGKVDAALALAIWLAARLIARDGREAQVIADEIDRLYLGANAEDMAWLVGVMEAVRDIPPPKGTEPEGPARV